MTTTITTPPTPTRPEMEGREISQALQESLEVMESMYLYNHWIFANIRGFIGPRILEVGAGIGNITRFLLSYTRVVALEPEAHSAEKAVQRFRSHQNVEIVQRTLEEYSLEHSQDGVFDTVICLNVLEHIADDVLALRCMREKLARDGPVIILVPALQSLYGELDRSLGHFRRYNRRSLRKRFQQAQLQEVKSFYMNLPGVLGWLLHSRILHRDYIARRSARKFDNAVPYIQAAESVFKPPVGQSLVMVGKPKV